VAGFRQGSGVYVRAQRPVAPSALEQAAEFVLDALIGELIARARNLGAPERMVRERLRRWLPLTPPSAGGAS
jgi:hypothetical protein